MVPIAGWAATSGKLVTKSIQNMAPIVKNVAKQVAPVVVPAAKKVINTVTTVAAPIVKNGKYGGNGGSTDSEEWKISARHDG